MEDNKGHAPLNAWLKGLALVVLSVVYQASWGESEIYFIHSDHLGTPQVLTDKDQRVVWRANYQPFGQATVDQDPDGDGEKVVFNLRFPGQYFDEETGLHYNYFRDYDPSTGRYVQSDPIGLAGGINTYGYVNQNPLIFSDPFGLKRCYMYQGNEICEYESGEPIRPGWSHGGANSAYSSRTNNARYEKCYKKCKETAPENKFVCTAIGAGATGLSKSKALGGGTKQVCQWVTKHAYCQKKCWNDEESCEQ